MVLVGCDAAAEADEMTRLLHGLIAEAEQKVPHYFGPARQKVVVIAGPTACGKSELAMMVAKTLGGDVISADSMQVYRNMDIGTAKVSVEERQQVTHHLIDVCDVSEPFNVVDFYYHGCHACQALHTQNRVPVVAGGSGFYLRTMLYGPPTGPPSVPEVRQRLQGEMDELGPDHMYGRLQLADPDYAATITRNDRQKIIRGLEILALTKKPVSSLSWRQRTRPLNFDFRCWFIYRSKDVLYDRINQRCDQMLGAGFLDEVEALRDQLVLNPSAAQAIGYRQALEYLDSGRSDEDYAEFVRKFKKASRRYAKQQFTWFRKEPLFRWLDVDLHDMETACDMICADYQDS